MSMTPTEKFPPMAAVDIGSNSIKLRVAHGGRANPLVLWDTTEICHLGQGLVEGKIPQETLDNAVRTVVGMVDCARGFGAEEICLVGTMALRVARNAGEFLSRIREATGLKVRIISGAEEARYAWRGAVSGLDLASVEGSMALFDTGGGSTEFVWGRVASAGGSSEIDRIQSVPVGAGTLVERFLGTGVVRPTVVDAALEYVHNLLDEYGVTRLDTAPATVVGLGGGVVAMASVKRGSEPFIPQELHGMELTRRDLKRQIRLYSLLTLEERRNVVGLPPSRADVVLGSACIVLCALETLGVPSCRLSLNGLRHGVLLEMFEEKSKEREFSK